MVSVQQTIETAKIMWILVSKKTFMLPHELGGLNNGVCTTNN